MKEKSLTFSFRGFLNNRSRRFLVVTGTAFALVAVMVAAFINLSLKTSASGIARSVIVELKDDPAAVWKAKTEKSGGSVSGEQLQSYRNSLKAKQDQFLA